MKKENEIILILVLVLLLIIGSTYAYFSINATSDNTGAKVTGKAGSLGNSTLKINTSKLYLNLDANLMSEANAGKTYYANEDESGLALTTNPNYILATAQLTDGDQPLDCEYNYKVTASIAKEITDGSDSDILVTIGDKSLTLKEILDSTDGIIVSGKIKNLTNGNDKTISLSSTASNTENKQDNLVGNAYTINIEPYNNGNTKAFSCKIHEDELSEKLIASGDLWQSGLENDGYRYVGSGAVGTDTNPKNFICFGTTDKTECVANQDKYMYRVLGIFSDANGDNHVKLIKYKQLISTVWNDTNSDVNWEDSTLYASLNDSEFLTNTTYDYLQNTTWSNRIENWTWSAVNTKTITNSGPNYMSNIALTQVYLHEMNRSTKTTMVGTWTTPSAKIGLMYASDYILSLGTKALSLTGSTSANATNLKAGWVHQSNNDTTKGTYEWTLSRYGADNNSIFFAWSVYSSGGIGNTSVTGSRGVRPVFYLTTDVVYSSGTGSVDDPFIIEE